MPRSVTLPPSVPAEMGDLIDRVIVPALLERFLREMRQAKGRDSLSVQPTVESRPCA